MKIKTFPLQFTEEKLEEIRDEAKKAGKPIYQFILDCIDEEIRFFKFERGEVGEQHKGK